MHFLLARLGPQAQLWLVETVKPNLKFRRETAETERENANPSIWQRCPQQRRKTRLVRSPE
jgi:hypothetical protein